MVRIGEERRWTEFRYECCHDFCYLCIIIGHSDKNCLTINKSVKEKERNQFGMWMRANILKSSGNSVEKVGGGTIFKPNKIETRMTSGQNEVQRSRFSKHGNDLGTNGV